MTAVTNDRAEQPLKIQKGRKSRALILLSQAGRHLVIAMAPAARTLKYVHFWHPAKCSPERSPVFTASRQLRAHSPASNDLSHIRRRIEPEKQKPCRAIKVGGANHLGLAPLCDITGHWITRAGGLFGLVERWGGKRGRRQTCCLLQSVKGHSALNGTSDGCALHVGTSLLGLQGVKNESRSPVYQGVDSLGGPVMKNRWWLKKKKRLATEDEKK